MRIPWIHLRLFIYLAGWISVLPADISMTADFEFAWDPPGSKIQPQGYYLYYHEGASVVDDPENANRVYIQATEPGFDPDHPGFSLVGLDDGVYYYFVVTADYIDQESAFSNEVIGIDGVTSKTKVNESTGRGCFIKTMR